MTLNLNVSIHKMGVIYSGGAQMYMIIWNMPVNRIKKGFLLERGLEEVPGVALDWSSQNKQRNNQKIRISHSVLRIRKSTFKWARPPKHAHSFCPHGYLSGERKNPSQPANNRINSLQISPTGNVHTRMTPEVPT